MTKNNTALLIFTKTPVEGRVKTRLIPKWGTEGALLLYKDLLKNTLETAISSSIDDVYLYCSPDKDDNFMKFCSTHYDVRLENQIGQDLGDKMFNAFEQKLNEYYKVILIGCDCPGLTADDIELADNKLNHGADIVLGPTEDGGYYLIALMKNHKDLFKNIPWGKPSVLHDTLDIISNLKMIVYELSEKWDLDRPDDVYRYFEQKVS